MGVTRKLIDVLSAQVYQFVELALVQQLLRLIGKGHAALHQIR